MVDVGMKGITKRWGAVVAVKTVDRAIADRAVIVLDRATRASDQIGPIAAAGSITVPLFLLVAPSQRRIDSALAAGAVRG